MGNLSVTHAEILATMQFLRTHLYAAQVQIQPGDDIIISRHVYAAYKRVADVCKEIELHGICD